MIHFLDIKDFSPKEIAHILDLSESLRDDLRHGNQSLLYKGKQLGMIFEKPSTRTRVSFQVGFSQLGGHVVHLSPDEVGLGTREPVKDIARVISRYVDVVMLRTFKHSDILEFADMATIPVVNGLSDRSHPCQAIADVLTIKENFETLEGLTMTYIGDGNNVCVSLIEIAAACGINMRVASPASHKPQTSISYQWFEDPLEASKGAHVIYTDCWTSMGDNETEERKALFKYYTVDSKLMKLADSSAIFLHCLPAYRGKEVSDDVMESPQSKVFDQAENRLHAQKGILHFLKEKNSV